MKNLYNWIIIIIFVIVLVWGFLSSIKYNKLEQSYNELLFEKSSIIDSLERDNVNHLIEIEQLKDGVLVLSHQVDSLKQVKISIIEDRNKFTISSSITEGANLLKRNLDATIINNSY